jgi:sulfur-carrier protein
MTVTLRYFAWVREKIGRTEERVELPEGIRTVADLIDWQLTRGPEYVSAFARREVVRVAIDQAHARSEAAIGSAREIAFFPPVTGG